MRLIDADALVWKIKTEKGGTPAMLVAVNSIPTVDAVQVVRCRDCRHYIPGVDKGPNKYTYPKCRVTDTVTSDHHYCAFGNAKTGGEQLTLLSEED